MNLANKLSRNLRKIFKNPSFQPYFTTFHHHHQQPPGPASANGLLQHGHHALQQQHQHQQPMQQPSSFMGPNSAPAVPCSADSGHSSLGGMVGSNSDHLRRPSSSSCRLVIRDPFAPDPAPAQQMQHSPMGQHQHQNGQQQQLSALNWDGKPPADSLENIEYFFIPFSAKSMAEMARLSAADGAQRPQLVPIPNFKEGGMPPPGLLPHYSFFQTPQQRQRLEQLYPPGTFPPNYWNRWSPMPVPAHMMRPLLPPPGRIVLVPWTPNMPPNLMPPWLAGRLPPGVVPFVSQSNCFGTFNSNHFQIVLPGPNGQLRMTPVAHVPPAMFGIPGPPPGAQTPAAGGQQLAQQQTGGGPTSGGSGGKQSGGGGQPAKPKKETAKQRKQREKQEEQQRRCEFLEFFEILKTFREQEQQQQQAAAAAAMAMGRSPMDPNGPGGMGGMPPPPPFYGAPGQMPPGPMCGQMPGPMGATQQQQQQQLTPQPDNNACFKGGNSFFMRKPLFCSPRPFASPEAFLLLVGALWTRQRSAGFVDANARASDPCPWPMLSLPVGN